MCRRLQRRPLRVRQSQRPAFSSYMLHFQLAGAVWQTGAAGLPGSLTSAARRFYAVLLLVLGFLLQPAFAQAQASITGQVRDSVTHAPLPFASVFLANTSRGATTDAEGRYKLTGITPGHYELGVSYVGYRLYRRAINLTSALTFNPDVAPDARQLAEVVVRPDPNRETDYQRFRELFLGTSTFSRQCQIVNPDEVRVAYDPRQNVLTAETLKPVEVENRALGYRLTFYQLDFRAEFQDQNMAVTVLTQVAFRELPGSAGRQRRWAANRARAYRGSQMHFLRSLYAGRVAEEGFRVRKMRRVVNQRRAAVAARLHREQEMGLGGILPDSIRKILTEPPVMTYLFKPLLPLDSMRRAEAGRGADGRVWLRFHDLLAVGYEGEKPDAAYRMAGPNFSSLQPETEESVLQLQLPEAEVEAFGTLVVPLAALSEGYWGFEKIGELLPLDYQLPAAGRSSAK